MAQMPRTWTLLAILIGLMLVQMVPAETSSAAVRSFEPAHATGNLLVYRLASVRNARIKRARLVSNGRTPRPVRTSRVRRASRRGVLRVRVGQRNPRPVFARAALARKWKLQVVTVPPPVAPTTECPALAELTVGIWPGGCWRPYSDASPFNRTLGGSPRVMGNSDAIVQRVLGFGTINNLVAGKADSGGDYEHPTYYSKVTDPVFRLHCYESSWGVCDIEGHEIRIPDAARPAAGGDAHLTVVDSASGWEYDLYKVRSKPSGGGTLEFRWGGRTRIDGDGLASGGTAAKFGNLAGIIRAQEMQAGEIRHALFMTVNCSSGQSVYPAARTGIGRPCSQIGLSNENAPAMGTRFQLAMSDQQIEALAVPAWKKTILRAMAQYGMYMGDTGGGSWGLQMESGSTYTSFGLEDAMVGFARQAQVPTYNGDHVFNMRDGVDWAKYLRVIDPCEAQSTC